MPVLWWFAGADVTTLHRHREIRRSAWNVGHLVTPVVGQQGRGRSWRIQDGTRSWDPIGSEDASSQTKCTSLGTNRGTEDVVDDRDDRGIGDARTETWRRKQRKLDRARVGRTVDDNSL